MGDGMSPVGSVEDATERSMYVAFRLAGVASTSRMDALKARFGSMERAWRADSTALRSVLGTRERLLAAIVKERGQIDPLREMENLARDEISVLTIADAGYPRLLREIGAPPPVLFLRGQLLETDSAAVAVVGTRRLTPYGREMAAAIAGGLAEAGVTIVSGLATGIDGIAHRAALDAGGRTFAVLGSGIRDIYPREHSALAKRIAGCGAVISDLPPHAKPDRWNFPARNRIISGLSLGVVVVEAPEKSGALITVDFAADQGRDVFVVPGAVTATASAGCNRLLRDGARPVRNADDVLCDLRLTSGPVEAVQQPLMVGDDERRILAVLTSVPQHIDELAESSGLPLPAISGLLLTLELQQLVRNHGAQHYTRV